MTTLATLLTDLDEKLGTSNQGYFTSSKKTTALNTARKEILIAYDIEEFITEANVVFTLGVGTLPTDFFRKVGKRGEKCRDLWNTSTDADYDRVDIDRFGDEDDFTWTEKLGQVLIFPEDTVTLRLRYIKNPTNMSSGVDVSGFSVQLDNAHAYYTAYLLLFMRRDYETAEMMRQKAIQQLDNSIAQVMMNKGDVREGTLERAMLNANRGSRDWTRDDVFIL